MARIVFTDAAVDDLRRIGPDVVPRVLKKLVILEQNPLAGYALGGELTGFRKLVVGRNTWRVVYRITEDGAVEICEVWAIGARADAQVYREALARVRDAAGDRPALVRLAEVVERIGRLAGTFGPPEPEPDKREAVPDWLAERLIFTVGMTREAVAALDLREAVDVWTAHLRRAAGR